MSYKGTIFDLSKRETNPPAVNNNLMVYSAIFNPGTFVVNANPRNKDFHNNYMHDSAEELQARASKCSWVKRPNAPRTKGINYTLAMAQRDIQESYNYDGWKGLEDRLDAIFDADLAEYEGK